MIYLAGALAYVATLTLIAWERHEARQRAPADIKADDLYRRLAELEAYVSKLNLTAGFGPRKTGT
jgi:hypothetical protein